MKNDVGLQLSQVVKKFTILTILWMEVGKKAHQTDKAWIPNLLRTVRSLLFPPACLQLDPLKLKMATWSAVRRHTGLIRASYIYNTTMVWSHIKYTSWYQLNGFRKTFCKKANLESKA